MAAWVKQLGIFMGIGLVVATCTLAWSDTTVVDGPGFKYEKKDGWFGTSQKTYYDALGNRIERKRGLFGKTKSKSTIFGSKIERNGENLTVSGPNGKPMITRKKTWFHGQKTQVDTNSIWDNVKSIFR